ncbi:hypothetical protein H8356DRAFT_972453 [Neocallimastix lanati (nom. inval.)]|jgi:hypothetical protein|uniref:Coth-domain-containing protein n=1 Tax=Neocallimastix californiae TaxID=1754190 RepID=A0A1Y2A4A7_9FUNG|nr:hypothetical protein H8356DRAFT_972453 [Neocallimastix sp. JGI-2020a]ORY16855.1 hypothetical protein LY90DRAFT_677396 [Neocallimastix californiae]|eukprot:ORY16855.1 hypothetical protein LY90DRAFT_677396 [Neocallimastix californiae]
MKILKVLNSLLFLSGYTLLTNADFVEFKVLAVTGTPTLNINYKQYPMKAVDNSYPLYSTIVELNEYPINYNYILDYGNGNTDQEEFVRQRNRDDEALNDFFGRSINVMEHPLLPRAYKQFPYFRSSKLFDDTYVATVIIKCDPTDLNNIYNINNTTKIPAEVIYASPYTVKTFKTAKLGLSGQSTMKVPKFSYKIKNLKDENDNGLYNRSSFKLRGEHMDPSFLREKIYGDVLNSLGVPVANNKFARVYINGRPIGLFDLGDSITSDRYLRETFNNGKKYDEKLVHPIFSTVRDYEKGVLSDLGYYGDDPNDVNYSVYNYKGDDKTNDSSYHIKTELIPFLKELNEYCVGNTEKSLLDIDYFLRYMALEYLGGAVDNYWSLTGNFILFKDLEKNQWFFHDSDFHHSFGDEWDGKSMLYTPISEFPPLLDERLPQKRAFLDAVLRRPENKEKLNKIFERLLKTSFHTNALFPRIESLTNLIREDAHWDFTLPRENPNPVLDTNIKYTSEDFETAAVSEKESGYDGEFSVRFFIKTKVKLVAQELGIQIPYDFENDLGFYENIGINDDSNDGDEKSGSVKTILWNIFTSLITILVVMIFY